MAVFGESLLEKIWQKDEREEEKSSLAPGVARARKRGREKRGGGRGAKKVPPPFQQQQVRVLPSSNEFRSPETLSFLARISHGEEEEVEEGTTSAFLYHYFP